MLHTPTRERQATLRRPAFFSYQQRAEALAAAHVSQEPLWSRSRLIHTMYGIVRGTEYAIGCRAVMGAYYGRLWRLQWHRVEVSG